LVKENASIAFFTENTDFPLQQHWLQLLISTFESLASEVMNFDSKTDFFGKIYEMITVSTDYNALNMVLFQAKLIMFEMVNSMKGIEQYKISNRLLIKLVMKFYRIDITTAIGSYVQVQQVVILSI